tara:strand:- start:230 stop:535 length:306 start_codon:yes stop_codon:yes gene_type:complete
MAEKTEYEYIEMCNDFKQRMIEKNKEISNLKIIITDYKKKLKSIQKQSNKLQTIVEILEKVNFLEIIDEISFDIDFNLKDENEIEEDEIDELTSHLLGEML